MARKLHWDPQKAIENVLQIKRPARAPNSEMRRDNELSIAELEKYMLFLAEMIDGPVPELQPLLDALEERYIEAKSKVSQTERIKALIAKHPAGNRSSK